MNNFQWALNKLHDGERVYRRGWNGKGMFIFLVEGSQFKVNRKPLLGIFKEDTLINYRSHIDIKLADNSVAVWTPIQTDLLGEDWEIFEK